MLREITSRSKTPTETFSGVGHSKKKGTDFYKNLQLMTLGVADWGLTTNAESLSATRKFFKELKT